MIMGKYGRMSVLNTFRKKSRIYFVCLCDCGKTKEVRKDLLVSGHTSSCGCLKAEMGRKGTHKLSKSPEYAIWCAMKARCFNKKNRDYKNYGRRGITVCKRWMKFENFISDMKKRPGPKHSIERIDNSKGYSNENCKWATREEQSRNTRKTIYITLNGVTKCITDWSKITGLKRNTIQYRLKRGWTPANTLLIPVVR